MQGLADAYFSVPYTVGNYLASVKPETLGADHPAVRDAMTEVSSRLQALLSKQGTRTVSSFHRELGEIMWHNCGMARDKRGLEVALQRIPELREEFWKNVNVPGSAESVNIARVHAGRVVDFLELGELMCKDALHREESCGGHFRTEHQTPDGEALRDDEHFAYVAAWEYAGEGKEPVLNKEPLVYENIKLSQRSYK